MATATLLLPSCSRLAGQPLPGQVALVLGRADRTPTWPPGERAQLLRHFDLLPRRWPVAALTRQLDADDACLSAWVRADPVYVRPDINGARLLAHGEAMQLGIEDVEALLPALRPMFGDTGFPIDAPSPQRWYLRLPKEVRLPIFVEPAEALGADLFEQLPGIDQGTSPEGRRWRALLSEAQIVLHNHPWNAQRIAAGKPPVNSLWFWGGGVLPDHVGSAHREVYSDDDLLRSLTVAARVPRASLPGRFAATEEDALFDLRRARDVAALSRDWLEPALAALQRRSLERLYLDAEDGSGFVLDRGQRWRFWRRPLRGFDAVPPGPSPVPDASRKQR